MQITKISIVYITDKKHKKQVTDNLDTFVGQRAVLVFDKNNKADPRAVKVLFQQYVGFVRMNEWSSLWYLCSCATPKIFPYSYDNAC